MLGVMTQRARGCDTAQQRPETRHRNVAIRAAVLATRRAALAARVVS